MEEGQDISRPPILRSFMAGILSQAAFFLSLYAFSRLAASMALKRDRTQEDRWAGRLARPPTSPPRPTHPYTPHPASFSPPVRPGLCSCIKAPALPRGRMNELPTPCCHLHCVPDGRHGGISRRTLFQAGGGSFSAVPGGTPPTPPACGRQRRGSISCLTAVSLALWRSTFSQAHRQLCWAARAGGPGAGGGGGPLRVGHKGTLASSSSGGREGGRREHTTMADSEYQAGMPPSALCSSSHSSVCAGHDVSCLSIFA